MLSCTVHGALNGTVSAPVSKSDLHRLIIACALSCGESLIHRYTLSQDIQATANVIGALQAARKQGLFTIGLTGDGGGRMAPLSDILLAVGHPSTPLVQETHAAIGHMLCALTDYYLFENVMAIKPMLD